ncbi:MAG TPA: ATP-dependent sacrificial sulfur transferase LarE [Syntrophorhabdaceae bacterium]|nr:ATP-dependent sacrificial sulfur transferase LarE [Syntrophorhabdaceae bacterium]HOT42743.1 ATP-dependent sacrificial sulfur transferase LarE [Syntrophorhabdaceae bacterium]HPC66138.1 ATP-dependent sacrificial sulfur transferase LarE [Syntrophorhabdaceae bacterium]HQE80690.1 ATP-dependent sacrificial sulfur transferase LarE [Syntrophorhabdaceae bacterium]HQH43958.1 ATP-dependent sacrificial sulfur transferase LarE [Syntrophorhabdaceae bacterium]
MHTDNKILQDKLEKLKVSIKALGRVIVAYSGGVDSTLLLKVCADTLGAHNVVGFIGTSPTYPVEEVKEAKKIADYIGVKCIISHTNEMEDKRFIANNPNRCYYCKSHLFDCLWAVAKAEGYHHVLEGSNLDDLKDFRPGRRACEEKNVKSPLIEAGLTKDDIRELSRILSLPTHSKPSLACLASRIPYGTPITAQLLRRIELSEKAVQALGIKQVRVRCHNDMARIEVDEKDFIQILQHRKKVVDALKQYGFLYVTIDLQGYRTGSMNETMGYKGLLEE